MFFVVSRVPARRVTVDTSSRRRFLACCTLSNKNQGRAVLALLILLGLYFPVWTTYISARYSIVFSFQYVDIVLSVVCNVAVRLLLLLGILRVWYYQEEIKAFFAAKSQRGMTGTRVHDSIAIQLPDHVKVFVR